MVRLVFRPYTQIWRSICTSESLRASTRVSSGFTLFRHSSPSFGSQHICSYSNLSKNIQIGRWCTLQVSHLHSLSLRVWVCHPNTRIYVRLLGPCFKTGRLKPLSQHPKHGRATSEYEKTSAQVKHSMSNRSHSTKSACPRASAAILSPIHVSTRAITQPKHATFSQLLSSNETDVDLHRKVHLHRCTSV